MTNAPFKPAGAAFAAIVAGLAPGAHATVEQTAEAPSPGADAEAALGAGLADLEALEPFAAPAAQLDPNADVPLGDALSRQGDLPF